eukprot:NODE_3263_length_1001_cov_19.440503_g3117_i0.p1 GENE.NODE_3263_length_1001_cov_19.440503_g3117_i0~~NODE_3263_length_1001_cov_19.440503_g3117_i0.p1  ORF type:complete len:267 (+),score=62.22 NODE_3263_length_1001_cov_19.440503_g3117_i0:56-802(+)
MASIESWWNSLGPITQKCLAIILAVMLTGTLGVINPYYFILDFTETFQHIQVWRLVTNMFFFGLLAGPAAFNVLVNTYLFVTYSGRLEEGDFKGKPADYVWMLILTQLVTTLVGGYALGMTTTARSLLSTVVWVWCRRNPDQPLNLFGLFDIKPLMFPWALMGIHWVFGQGFIPDLVGNFSGHFYIFLMDVLPVSHGWHLLTTPHFLRRQLPDTRTIGGMTAYAPVNRQPVQPAGRHSWGSGRTLGSS